MAPRTVTRVIAILLALSLIGCASTKKVSRPSYDDPPEDEPRLRVYGGLGVGIPEAVHAQFGWHPVRLLSVDARAWTGIFSYGAEVAATLHVRVAASDKYVWSVRGDAHVGAGRQQDVSEDSDPGSFTTAGCGLGLGVTRHGFELRLLVGVWRSHADKLQPAGRSTPGVTLTFLFGS